MVAFINEKIKALFTTFCFIAVSFMIGYWVYKYKVEDRDIGVVDYLSLSNAIDVDFPLAALCFNRPFINENLRQVSQNQENLITIDDYVEYLEGKNYDGRYELFEYKNVSLDLGNYFLYSEVQWKNSTYQWQNSSSKVEHKEVFNGFLTGSFRKCFVLRYDVDTNRNVKMVRFHYDLPKLLKDLNGFGSSELKFYLRLYYPGQFFLGEYQAPVYLHKTSTPLLVWIKELEILQKRKTDKRKCYEKTNSYDNMVMESYLASVECRVPYLYHDNSSPLCNTAEKIKNSNLQYTFPELLNIPKACKRISRVGVRKMNPKKGKGYSRRKKWHFTLSYPKEVKIITQSKEVDIHSLIGNIGGYFGLFLGRI